MEVFTDSRYISVPNSEIGAEFSELRELHLYAVGNDRKALIKSIRKFLLVDSPKESKYRTIVQLLDNSNSTVPEKPV